MISFRHGFRGFHGKKTKKICVFRVIPVSYTHLDVYKRQTVICTDKTGTLTQNLMQVYEPNFYGLKDGKEIGEDDLSKLVMEGILSLIHIFRCGDCRNSPWIRDALQTASLPGTIR